MPVEARVAAAFALSLCVTAAATPLARAIAIRAGLQDHPGGRKRHAGPTPYLGGTAVLAGILTAGLALADGAGKLSPILAGAGAVAAVGLVDDRAGLRPAYRLLTEAGAAALLWATGLGWSLTGSGAVDLVLTVAWVIAITNAFNLLDNMDGTAATTAGVAAAAIGVLAALNGGGLVAALAFALVGACAGFLPSNLAGPARIFLGDGGSLPIGFVVAACAAAVPWPDDLGMAALPAAVVLLGVPVADTALVVVSRRRRGVSIFTAGRDHLTHRLRAHAGSDARVALLLAAAQGLLGGLAVVAAQAGSAEVLGVAAGYALLAAATLTMAEASLPHPRPRRSVA